MSQLATACRSLALAALLVCGTASVRAEDAPKPAAEAEPMVALAQRLAGEPETSSRESLPLGPSNAGAHGSSATSPAAPDGAGWLVNTGIALAAVIGLILIFRAALQRIAGRSFGARSGAIEVLARVPVANRASVLLLRTGSRVLIVGESPAGLTALGDVTDPDEIGTILAAVSASQPRSISSGFSEMFQRFNRDYREDAQIAEEGGDDAEVSVDRARDGLSGLLSRVRTLASAVESRGAAR